MTAPAHTFVIAEAGVNHNGSSELAFKLLQTAAECGADAIKFQTFNAASLVTERAKMADYQERNTGKSESQHAMLQRLELPLQTFKDLAEEAQRQNIQFMSTAFDSLSLEFLVGEIGVRTLKVASGELTNAPFLLEHARTGCDLIVSTGMATLAEVEAALALIAFGWQEPEATPTAPGIAEAYANPALRERLRAQVSVLHCTTQYPTPADEVNLAAMDTLASAFGLVTGYSDHTQGDAVSVAAVARGARIIEKHFTLDRDMEGPDHKASLEPGELAQMVQSIRVVERAIGDATKGPLPAELEILKVARKSLIAATDIQAGDAFSPDNLTVKRPGNGRSPADYWALLGKRANRNYESGDLIDD